MKNKKTRELRTVEGEIVTISYLSPAIEKKLNKFGDTVLTLDDNRGIRYKFYPANSKDYRISIVKHAGSYGVKDDLWEVAHIYKKLIDIGDIRGFMTDDMVVDFVKEFIKSIPLDSKT